MTDFAIIRTIPLTQGKVAIVDQADYGMLSHWKWYAAADSATWYARRGHRHSGAKHMTISLMHRMVMLPDPSLVVDHVNGNGLDNRRCNLRICTQGQNQQNQRAWTGTLYKGVRWAPRQRRWVASINPGERRLHLGYFKTAEEAARAYDSAAMSHYGSFARPNFPAEVSS